MKLPKLEFPRYETTLPWSGKQISYRPYSHGEEKILMMASASNNIKEEYDAVLQLIENCCSVDPKLLHPIDFEWCYIQLRIASVSPILDVTLENDCSCESKPETLSASIDLTKVEVEGLDELEEKGFIKKKDSWIIMLTDDIGVQFRDIKESFEGDPIKATIQAIFEGDQVIDVENLEDGELQEFIDGSPAFAVEKIMSFFDHQPRTKADFKTVCSCGKVQSHTVRGLINFFG